MPTLWIEEYQCGCSSQADRKKDLLGYCDVHGADAVGSYKLPICEWCRKAKVNPNITARYENAQGRTVHRITGRSGVRWVDCKQAIEYRRAR